MTRLTSWEKLLPGRNPKGGLVKKRRSSLQVDTIANYWGKDNLLRLGIEVKQKKGPESICSVSQPPIECKWNKF